jgi:TrmH family RNA methyltransferase
MDILTSKDNPVLKAARKLLTRKGRACAGAFLLEGRKLISEAQSAGFVIERIFLNAGALLRGEIVAGAFSEEKALEEKLFMGLAQTKTPQPYIAVVKHPKADKRDGSFVSRVLVLDRVSDPGNAGTMIRTALAAGMDEVWCVKGTADLWSDKVIRASAGAVFHLPVAEELSAADCIGRTKDLGLELIVCDAGGEGLFDTNLPDRLVIVVGNEGEGAQAEFLEEADGVVGIPMEGASESLNAAVAAAIVMYEARRRRQ